MDTAAFRAWIARAAQEVVGNADHLTHLDAAIGDADHGINLSRGLRAAVAMLDETDPATPAAVLSTVGRALISKTGGASGAVVGPAFPAAGERLGEGPGGPPGQGARALAAAPRAGEVLSARAPGREGMWRESGAVGPAPGRLAERHGAQGRSAAADIVAVGALIAVDPELVEVARNVGVAAAVEGYAGTLAALPDPTLRERAADVRQVGRRVLRRLAGLDADPPAGPFVLLAGEIGPADLLEH